MTAGRSGVRFTAKRGLEKQGQVLPRKRDDNFGAAVQQTKPPTHSSQHLSKVSSAGVRSCDPKFHQIEAYQLC